VNFLGHSSFFFIGFTAVQCVHSSYEGGDTKTSPFMLFYIALSFGFSLAINVWAFYRISGGIFNPAITLGMVLLGVMPPLKGALLSAAQLVGSIFAAGLAEILLPGDLAVNTKINYSTGISTAQSLFLEAFLTFQLTFVVYMLAVEKHRATFMAPFGIGLALCVTHLAGINFSGASLNPARSFGPAVITADFVSYHWIYWVGPVLGSVAATGLYKLLLVTEYQTCNPRQDHDGLDIYPIDSKFAHTRHSSSASDVAREIDAVRGRDMV